MKDVVGGLARSSEVNFKDTSITLDSGPHIFHTKDEEMIEIWKENFSEFWVEQNLFSANAKGSKFDDFHDYPISKEGLSKKGFYLSTAQNNKKNHFVFNNYRDYMQSRVGEKIEKEYFRNYPEKLWGISTKKMRADWAPKRIQIREKISPFFDGQWCATSYLGSGAIYKKISEDISKNGGKIKLNNQVRKLVSKDSRITNIVTDKNNFEVREDCLVLSTLPTIQLGRLLGIKEKSNYRWVAIISAVHSFETFPERYSWIYFDSSEIIFTRVTDFSKLSPGATKGEIIYIYEVPFDSNFPPNNNTLKKEVIESIGLIPWLKESFQEFINIQVEKYVYPIREEGYEILNSRINGLSDSFINLRRCGTAAEFEYGDVQICFRKSLDMANDLVREFTENNDEDKKVFFQSSKISNTRNFLNNTTKKKIFIAEIGLNHNGSIDMAKRLIDVASNANADLVKLQFYNSETRANKYTRDAFYQEESDGEGENLYQIFKRCEFNFEQMQELYDYSLKSKINLFFSAFDRKTVQLAHKISPNLLKISSMDLSNFEVCDEGSKLFKNIIMSTGMSTMQDIKKSSNFLKERVDNLTLLHCISSYPMNLLNISLGTISELYKYADSVGYSDHSMNSSTSLMAAMAGAQTIEKHITLDKNLPGPDHIHSLSPEELNNLVEQLHNFNKIMNIRQGIIGVENKEYRRQKKGYYYKKDKEIGSTLLISDLVLMPPCLGSDTFEVNTLIGKNLTKQIKSFDPVRNTDYE